MTDAITATREALRANGFHPIPCQGKAPALNEWQRANGATPALFRDWERLFPEARNTGALTADTPFLDIDLLNPEAAGAVEALVRARHGEHGTFLVRFGMAPKRAIPFRCDKPFRKIAVALYAPNARPDDKPEKIELLCDGQQIIVDGIHPDTGRAYSWHGGDLFWTSRNELPAITKADARDLIDDIAELLVTEHGYSRTGPEPKSSGAANVPPHAGNGSDGDRSPEPWTELEEARLRSALAAIPADEKALVKTLGAPAHDSFVKIGAAIERLGWEERGYEILRDWCKQSPEYDEAGLRRQWASFQRNRDRANAATVATVYHFAMEFGWEAPVVEPTPSQPQQQVPADQDQGLGEWDAGEIDDSTAPPRGWIYGNVFCRGFVSSLLAEGAIGKTATRYAQLLSCASGRALLGEHVFVRSRCLIISLEDDGHELMRRLRAARLHHKVEQQELKGWLFVAAPGRKGGKLLAPDKNGNLVTAGLAERIEKVILSRKIDLVMLDPFVKSHAVNENDNKAIDAVVEVLTELCAKHDIAVDVPHHMGKGTADPGNASRGRGASAMKDAARLVYTLTPMTPEEARCLGLTEDQRRFLIRMDSGKVNIAPPMTEAKWFRLVGIQIGNGTDLYPAGDTVQTVESWIPPDKWAGLSNYAINQILNDLDAGLPDGNRFSDSANAKERAAWKVVVKYVEKPEAQAKEIIKAWVKTGLLYSKEYDNRKTRKEATGLWVDNSKRPG